MDSLPITSFDSCGSWSTVAKLFLSVLLPASWLVYTHIEQCTIHQPSAVLFDAFDSLLLLAKGGKMAYFGESTSSHLKPNPQS